MVFATAIFEILKDYTEAYLGPCQVSMMKDFSKRI